VSIHSPTGEVAALNADRETPKNGTYLIIRNNHFTAWKGAGS
jgi:hypothetical protein